MKHPHKKLATHILCTIGPTSESKTVISGLVKAGVQGLRINLSHTPPEKALAIARTIRSVSKTVPLIIDTQGKETRVGSLAGSITISTGDTLTITHSHTHPLPALHISRSDVFDVVRRGDRFSLDDNALEFKIMNIDREHSHLTVVAVKGGVVAAPKNIKFKKPFEPKYPLTERDLETIKLLAPLGITEVSLSYVTDAADIKHLRAMVSKNIQISSKIEKMAAITNLDEIIQGSDRVFIDRNDLGTEIGYEKIPLVQKFITARCIAAEKPVFVATHLLENMITKDKPTRGEVNDIINLVLDGVHGLILSSETAVGKDPVRIVKTLQTLIAQAEFILHKTKGAVADTLARLDTLHYL